MKEIVVAITAASYSGNKGAAAMLQSSIVQLHKKYGEQLKINLMSVYPEEDKEQIPHDFVDIVSCKPEQLLFIAFPLAILYKGLGWIPGMKALLKKNKIIKAYAGTDLVVDEAGISFVDSRGFVMNTYAFVCAAVPMLVGTPVVKYSQAMGTFQNPYNRFLAKWILPKLSLICARGQGTYDNLAGIGVTQNVKLCADGAFTMEDSERWNKEVTQVCEKDSFYNDNVIGLSISSVVQKKCTKLNIDYKTTMIQLVDYLNSQGYPVLLIANAARIHSQKPRNNDLMIGDAIYEGIAKKDMVRWYHKEMDAEEIRAYIGKCRFLIASRFHAMIGALEQKVPVLLIGWSHKYQEVLDMFELGQYAIDFSKLDLKLIQEEFKKFVAEESVIREKLEKNHKAVLVSSANNVVYISEVLDEVVKKKSGKIGKGFVDFNAPEKYTGEYIACRKGYSSKEEIRANAASGGMITGLLLFLLKTGKIDGAWVTKTEIKDGKLGYRTYIATTEEEIRDASSSIYMDMPLLKHIDMVKNFDGRVAVVLVPCLMRALNSMMERDQELADKIVLKLGLYCSGNHSDKATLLSMEKSNISLDNAKRLYYRRGHWRGQSAVVNEDGSEQHFSYTKTICAYKNAYFFEKSSCMLCQDHYASSADISFGDIWLKEMKGNPIKHTSCVIRSKRAMEWFQEAVDAGELVASYISGRDILRSQKRALNFKFNCAKAKKAYYEKKTGRVNINTEEKCKWNHRLAFFLARRNKEFSEQHYDALAKIPSAVIYYYMCFIRVLLSF